MAVVYSVAVRSARLQVVANAIDAGVGSGRLLVGTLGMGTLIVNIPLAKPCGVVAAGVLTFSVPQVANASAAGLAAEAQMTDSAGTVVISGLTVGLAGTDLIISNNPVGNGAPVSFISGQITGN